MHMAAEQWLKSNVEPDWLLDTFNGFALDDECIDAVKLYRQTLLDDREAHGGSLLVERKFDLSELRPGLFGTNDASLVLCPDRVLRVYDFKGGKGVPVLAERNKQMLYYGLGALMKYGKEYNPSELELVIVQPRCPHSEGPVRRWRVDLMDVYDWSQDLLEAAAATDDPHAPLHAGDWCRWCPCAGSCPAYKDMAANAIALDFAPIHPQPLPDPKLLTNAEIGEILPRIGIAEDWIRLVYAHALGELEAGRDIPGYKLVAKRGRRHWRSDDAREIEKELRLFGLLGDDLYTRDLKSPAQIEKLIKKEHRAELKPLIEMRSGGVTLVPDDDPRPSVSGTGVQVFTPLPEAEL